MSSHDGTMVVNFGKYRGKTLEEIPSGYLKWMMENLEEPEYTELLEAADTEYQWRDMFGEHFYEER